MYSIFSLNTAEEVINTRRLVELLHFFSQLQDEPGEVVILREKATVEGQQDKQAGDNKQGSKRNSLDSKTVQGLAQDLAAECAKAYALMENSLTKFSTDFGPFGMTPRGRVSLTCDFILFSSFCERSSGGDYKHVCPEFIMQTTWIVFYLPKTNHDLMLV